MVAIVAPRCAGLVCAGFVIVKNKQNPQNCDAFLSCMHFLDLNMLFVHTNAERQMLINKSRQRPTHPVTAAAAATIRIDG